MQMIARFRDRSDAGRRLASSLQEHAGPDVLVLGLARGGVPVAYEVARTLRAPLDVLMVRKLGVPGHEELAMGALAPGGARVVNRDVVRLLHIPDSVIEDVANNQQKEIERQERAYRRGLQAATVRGRPIVVVDDGLATGASMRAAIAYLRTSGATRITVAVPTGSPETCDELRQDADEVFCLSAPSGFFAIGQSYDDFSHTTDDEVCDLLARASKRREGPHSALQR
jgi:putative phosphoribosyl transferase